MKKCKIFDTSAILILLYQAKAPEILELITDAGYHILIPKEVYREIKEDFSIVGELLKNGKIDLLPLLGEERINEMRRKHPSFGDGEISVLLTCKDRHSDEEKCRCILDDKDAKKFAKGRDIKVNGVLGLLLWLKKLNKINKDVCLRISMELKNNPRIPKELLEELTK